MVWVPLTPDSPPVKSSYKEAVNPPLFDPDEGEQHTTTFAFEWLPYLLGAASQLQMLDAWKGTPEEQQLAVDRASMLKDMIYQGTHGGVPTPYWDDAQDLDDQEPASEQEWYGIFDGSFHETVENFVIAGFIAYSGNVGAAITFLTIAPRFRLAWKTGDLGGIIRVIIDGSDAGTVDTFADEEGVLERDYVGDPDEDEHRILMVLESVP